MAPNRSWICCLAVVLSACLDAAPKTVALPAAAAAQPRGSTATPTLDGVRSKDFVRCGVTTASPDSRRRMLRESGEASMSTCAGRSRLRVSATRRRSGSRRSPRRSVSRRSRPAKSTCCRALRRSRFSATSNSASSSRRSTGTTAPLSSSASRPTSSRSGISTARRSASSGERPTRSTWPTIFVSTSSPSRRS